MDMRGLLAVLLACGCVSLVEAKDEQWPDAMDYLQAPADCAGSDDVTLCENRKEVWNRDYNGAIAGDYQGQRNVSFCLSTGCDDMFGGTIRKNAILGCAWRMVIVNSGHLDADSTDVANLKHFCGPEYLDDTGRDMAAAQARTLLKKLKIAN